jgi:hypothetical protein
VKAPAEGEGLWSLRSRRRNAVTSRQGQYPIVARTGGPGGESADSIIREQADGLTLPSRGLYQEARTCRPEMTADLNGS